MKRQNLLQITVFLIAILFSQTKGQAQDMQAGFDMLNQGQFDNARLYFEDVIKEYPDNKTAQLCYGRALGLSGSPAQANQHFSSMLATDSLNIELQINYAESFLWQKDFKNAIPYYIQLDKANPERFEIILGLANAYAGAKITDNALTQIKRATKLQPNSQGALTSLKYIRLAKAAELSNDSKEQEAVALLNENLQIFEHDALSLNAIANLYLKTENLSAAKETFEKHQSLIEKYLGLSLVQHKKGLNKQALILAIQADSIAQQKSDQDQGLRAKERLIQAHLWNQKLGKVKLLVKDAYLQFGTIEPVLALDAQFQMYLGSFAKAIVLYETILAKNIQSFNANLGIANAFWAQSDYANAKKYAQLTLEHYPNQKDALQLLSKIERLRNIVVTPSANYTVDNAKNKAFQTGLQIKVPLSYGFSVTGGYVKRNTKNNITQYQANSQSLRFGLEYKMPKNMALALELGFINAVLPTTSYTNLEGRLNFSLKPLSRQNITVELSRNLQAFNAQLIEQKIFMNTISLSHNYVTSQRLGWFSNYQFTRQTDDNSRHLFFSSLYYATAGKHTIKGGLNYQYLSFSKQRAAVYYSPKKYQAVEGFLEASGKLNTISYRGLVAFGRQFEIDMEGSNSFRAELNLDIPITTGFNANIYGKYSNIASQITSGFSFSEVGIRLNWKPFKSQNNKAKAD
ncbi:MAG: tetratricopeptide repeat protein [Gilvibacter sp.]